MDIAIATFFGCRQLPATTLRLLQFLRECDIMKTALEKVTERRRKEKR